MLPETRPTLFDTLAMTGGMPNASRVGNVISEPEPTAALIPPAATPAAKIASASGASTNLPHVHDRMSGQRRGPRRPAGIAVLDDQRQPEALRQVPLGEHQLDRAGRQHGALAQQ